MPQQSQAQPPPLPDTPSPQRMTKAGYRLACLRRSPKFVASVVEFHRRYPPVFVARNGMLPGTGWPDRKPGPRSKRSPWTLPVSGKGRVLFGDPKTLGELHLLDGLAVGVFLAGYRRLDPEDGDEYFELLGSSRQAWQNDFAELGKKWPEVSVRWLRWPRAESLQPRPQLLLPGQSLPTGVIALIPVYEDTTEVERDESWKVALEVRRANPPRQAKKRRTRPLDYPKRLEVYDLYQRLRVFREVSRLLSLPTSTVSRLYAEAYLDIEGERPKGPRKTRRAAGLDRQRLAEQIEACPRCQQQPFCQSHGPSVEAYVSQD